MAHRNSAFAIILDRGQILLVKARGKPHWQLPGGGIEPGESTGEALVREVREETGLRAEVRGLTGSYRRPDGSRVFVYEVRAEGTLAGSSDEIAEQRWVRVSRAKEMVSESTRTRLIEGVARIISEARLPRPGALR